jgi:broad specificity phosphatase PhoE
MSDTERLLLVRHAMPQVEPSVPAELWELGDEGRAAARALRPLIDGPAYYVASTELKALQTLQEIAGHLDVATDAELVEVRRPHGWSADYRAVARSYVEGICPDGWEPHGEVIGRFDAAVARHAAVAGARNSTLVIGTHGLAPTIWLASRYRLEPNPAEFWASLRFPDLIEVTRTHTFGEVVVIRVINCGHQRAVSRLASWRSSAGRGR